MKVIFTRTIKVLKELKHKYEQRRGPNIQQGMAARNTIPKMPTIEGSAIKEEDEGYEACNATQYDKDMDNKNDRIWRSLAQVCVARTVTDKR